jgi:hypothetical protein
MLSHQLPRRTKALSVAPIQQGAFREYLWNDPERCVHIGDRQSDIYELQKAVGAHFLVRTCVDRLAEVGKIRLPMKCEKCASKGCIATSRLRGDCKSVCI